MASLAELQFSIRTPNELILFVVPLVFIYLAIGVMLPRVKDIGLPGATLLLILVPIVNVVFMLVLLFIPTGEWQGISRRDAVAADLPLQTGDDASDRREYREDLY